MSFFNQLDFFDFSAPDGVSLASLIRNSGVEGAVGTYILGDTGMSHMLETVKERGDIYETDWSKIGIGIAQDNMGTVKVTILYLGE